MTALDRHACSPPPVGFSLPTGVVARLHQRARRTPEALAFSFLDEGDPSGARTNRRCQELHMRARQVAAGLRQSVASGARALLLFPPGLDFIDAFLGCLYAGVIAVPAYPPDPARLERTLPRLAAIARNAEVSVVLTQSFVLGLREALPDLPPELASQPWLAVDQLREDDGHTVADPSAEALAFLQYTSGSTGTPRGVMISHGNLVANMGMIARAMDLRPGDVAVSWLPLFHDMGLIGTTLTALCNETPVHLMSPLDFLRRPLSWLRTISDTGATVSGAPNFAYSLCARRVRPEDIERLDLSRWRLAFNGAEPVDPAVLARFAEVFAPCGFRPEGLFPTYGLAEATLLASGGPAGQQPTIERFSPGLLERRIADPHPEGRLLAASGKAPPSRLCIVQDGQAVADGRVGEIWLQGPHVAQGYWNNPEATARAFGHTLEGHEGRWLATGDLGFLAEGQLFVTGRIKELIILHGRNVVPHDLERTAEASHPAARPGSFAAFGVPREGGEVVGMLIETSLEGEALAEVIRAARRAISERQGVTVEAILPVPRRSLPKTSSGKLMRSACCAIYLAQETAAPAPTAEAPPAPASLALLVDALVTVTGVSREALRPDATLAELGLDSVVIAELSAHLEDQLGRPVSVEGLEGASLQQIADQLTAAPAAEAPMDWQSRDVSHFQSATGDDLFEIHQHFARWSREARPGGYELYDQPLTTAPSARVSLGGEAPGAESLINLASYNYLGLSTHPEVARAAAEAVQRYGLSASGSPMLSGLLAVHQELEAELADFKGVEDVLIFPTGYSTNVGVISALVGPGDVVIADALAHASIVDGVALSRARMVYFRHNDMRSLERALRRAEGRVLVAVEGVYSMDGDLPPLPEIVALCRRYGARLLVDEAHSAFVFGENGRGVVEHLGVEDGVDVHIGTLSKSMGGMGGYVGGSAELIDYVRTYARSRTFSCALAPPVAGGLLAALRVLRANPQLRTRLWENVRVMQEALLGEGVDIGQTRSQVIPVLVHDDERIFDITRDLLQAGVYLNPVRYPAVKKNHARFRISVSATHSPRDLLRAARVIGDVLRSHEVIQ